MLVWARSDKAIEKSKPLQQPCDRWCPHFGEHDDRYGGQQRPGQHVMVVVHAHSDPAESDESREGQGEEAKAWRHRQHG